MNKSKLMYGSLGLLSLLSLVGIFTDQKIFLCFFAFIIHFQYLFKETDEMMEAYMNKSAMISFYANSISFVLAMFISLFVLNHELYKSLIFSLALSWSISILVYTILILNYEIREKIGIKND
ncbi:DUF3796 domain-containing protein [Aerococcus kribbianus]|uniref:DUF3796 domain-containing protein n=1 Tax=Aerococcus kribbianus TaxID=2999064 RepID=A0A9X3JDG1_9LACT|nr:MULTISPECIES: DUF3796 domain-containing protein [unclassified Aerococcus]MCZ0717455.1 DUF3796 domain-containing protein [Aerococcus sp. YH-aer221]MCZ0725743.1 DUF3796 domain-containing protein [Aerococcus sp. YH-aer222]